MSTDRRPPQSPQSPVAPSPRSRGEGWGEGAPDAAESLSSAESADPQQVSRPDFHQALDASLAESATASDAAALEAELAALDEVLRRPPDPAERVEMAPERAAVSAQGSLEPVEDVTQELARRPPLPTARVPPPVRARHAWIVPVAIGAVIGMLAGASLTYWIWRESRHGPASAAVTLKDGPDPLARADARKPDVSGPGPAPAAPAAPAPRRDAPPATTPAIRPTPAPSASTASDAAPPRTSVTTPTATTSARPTTTDLTVAKGSAREPIPARESVTLTGALPVPLVDAPAAIRPPAEPTSPPAAAVAGIGKVAAPLPAPTVPTAAATSTTSRVEAAAIAHEEAAIDVTLRRYEDAYERLDARAAAAVWPTVDEKALARAFSGLASQGLTFDNCEVVIRARTATASCRGLAEYVTRVGRPLVHVEPRQWTFALRKTGDAWKIESVEGRR